MLQQKKHAHASAFQCSAGRSQSKNQHSRRATGQRNGSHCFSKKNTRTRRLFNALQGAHRAKTSIPVERQDRGTVVIASAKKHAHASAFQCSAGRSQSKNKHSRRATGQRNGSHCFGKKTRARVSFSMLCRALTEQKQAFPSSDRTEER